MKSNLFILTKVQLKTGLSVQGRGRKNRSALLIFGLIAVAFLPLIIEIVKFLSDAYNALERIGQQGVLLSLSFTISSLVIFLFGIFYVLNIFYFANDVESLLPLPLKPGEILGAKFLVTVFYEYLTGIAFVLPIVAVYGVKSGGGVLFWLYAVLAFLLLPVIPLALASYIILPLMRFTGFAKNKDRFRLVGGIFALVLAFGYSYLNQKFVGSTLTSEGLQDLFLKGNNSLVGIVSRIFPTSRFAAESLVNASNISGLTNMALFFLVCALAFVLFLYLGEALYFQGVMGISETSARRRKLTSDELDKNISSKSVLMTCLLKELRILFRTPVYFLNCVIMNFLYPLFLIFPFLAQSSAGSLMGELGHIINNEKFGGYVLVGAFTLILLVSSNNGITSTAISREGSNLYISKYIPAKYSTQIMAKVLSGVLLSAGGILSLLLISAILFKINAAMMFAILVTGLAGALFTAFVGIMIDIIRPKLNWDNEQKAVKQNFNMLFTALICLAAAGVTIFGVIRLKLGFAETLAAILILYGLLDILMYYLVKTAGVKRFSEIET